MEFYIAVDTETTGLNPEAGDRIVEIAAIPIYNGKVYEQHAFYSMVNPMVRVPADVTGIHGSKNEDLEEFPGVDTIFPRFREYIGSAILVIHNAAVDLHFLDLAAKETGTFPISNRFIDTLEVAKYLYPHSSNSLKSLARRFGIKVERFHRARVDALVTARIFVKFMDILGEKNIRRFIRRWRGSV